MTPNEKELQLKKAAALRAQAQMGSQNKTYTQEKTPRSMQSSGVVGETIPSDMRQRMEALELEQRARR